MAHLTPQQAEAFGDQIGPTVRFLFLARERMQNLHFAHDDPLCLAVCKAQDAMYALRIHLHYASCERGVGEPPAKPPAGNEPT